MKNIIFFEKSYDKEVINLLNKILKETSSVLISGGNSIKKITKKFNNKIYIKKNSSIFLSDERLYNNLNDLRTNYSNLKKNFFSVYKFLKINFIYFILGQNDEVIDKIFQKNIKYQMPKVAILSLGNDGHICSIFKNSESVKLNQYLEIIKPKNKIKRVTVNKKLLSKIPKIYVLVSGSKKGIVLKKIFNGKDTMFPFKSYKKFIFILNQAAYKNFKNI